MNTLTNNTEALVRLRIRDAFHAASIHFGSWRDLDDSCTAADVEVAAERIDAIVAALNDAELATAELASIEAASEAALLALGSARTCIIVLRETASLLGAQLSWASETAA